MDTPVNRPEAPSLHRELPPGFGDLLPEAAERLLALRERLLTVFALWGYRPLLPPTVEFAEVFTRAQATAADEALLHKLLDRTTGQLLALRPDFTPQVARAAATRFRGASPPLRFCYDGPVVRHVQAQRGRSRQLHQVGAELLGVDGPDGDAEIVALVVEALKAAGLSSFKVDVGQVEFYKGVLAGLDLASHDVALVERCVARKDLSGLTAALEGLPLPDRKKRLLAELPLLAGGVEVLARADALVESDHSRAALENLSRVVELLGGYGVGEHLTIDLGELRGVDYHTGVLFEAFVHHLGSPLCKGGRYDGLVARFGADLPATGFSLDLLAVMEALGVQEGEAVPAPRGAYLVDATAGGREAAPLACRLRAAGVRAAVELVERPLAESLAHAREQGFRWVLVLGGPEAVPGAYLTVHLPSGRRDLLPLESIERRLAAEE